MKQTRNNKLKHTVKFLRVLNQPATWIEVAVIEPAETVKGKLLKQFEIDKNVPNLFSNRRNDKYTIKT